MLAVVSSSLCLSSGASSPAISDSFRSSSVVLSWYRRHLKYSITKTMQTMATMLKPVMNMNLLGVGFPGLGAGTCAGVGAQDTGRTGSKPADRI